MEAKDMFRVIDTYANPEKRRKTVSGCQFVLRATYPWSLEVTPELTRAWSLVFSKVGEEGASIRKLLKSAQLDFLTKVRGLDKVRRPKLTNFLYYYLHYQEEDPVDPTELAVKLILFNRISIATIFTGQGLVEAQGWKNVYQQFIREKEDFEKKVGRYRLSKRIRSFDPNDYTRPNVNDPLRNVNNLLSYNRFGRVMNNFYAHIDARHRTSGLFSPRFERDKQMVKIMDDVIATNDLRWPEPEDEDKIYDAAGLTMAKYGLVFLPVAVALLERGYNLSEFTS